MHRNVHFKKITTRRSETSPTVAAATLAQAFKVNFDFLNLYRFHSILTQSFQDTSAAMGTSSVTLTVQQDLINILLCFYSWNSCCFNSRPANPQEPKVLKQVPMPPSPVKPWEKFPRALSRNQNARRQHRLLLLVQCHRFMWNRPISRNPDTASTVSFSISTPATRSVNRCAWADCRSSGSNHIISCSPKTDKHCTPSR